MRQNESARPTRDEAGTITETAPRNSQPNSNTRRDVTALTVATGEALARRLAHGAVEGWAGEARAGGLVRHALRTVQGREAQIVMLARALVMLATTASASNIISTDVAGGGDVE